MIELLRNHSRHRDYSVRFRDLANRPFDYDGRVYVPTGGAFARELPSLELKQFNSGTRVIPIKLIVDARNQNYKRPADKPTRFQRLLDWWNQ